MNHPSEITFRARQRELRGESIGSGPTVVLLHAGGERAVSVDQRGHGDTGGSFGCELSVYADDVVAVVRSLGARVTLAGCSLGGLAALLAATGPEAEQHLDGLVLVDVVPDPDPVRARRHLRAARQLQPSHRRPEPPWSLIEDILRRSTELRTAAAAVRAPITLIRGTSSWAIDADDQERFSELVPQTFLVTIEGSGHLVARERPGGLAEALLAHIDRCTVEDRAVLHRLSTLTPSIGGADPASSWNQHPTKENVHVHHR
jgi:pimeloyl-ACP methyl ester carboxylesterase